jgi:hypothetical protein
MPKDLDTIGLFISRLSFSKPEDPSPDLGEILLFSRISSLCSKDELGWKRSEKDQDRD